MEAKEQGSIALLDTDVLYCEDYLVDSYRDGGEEEDAEDESHPSEATLFYQQACSAVVGA